MTIHKGEHENSHFSQDRESSGDSVMHRYGNQQSAGRAVASLFCRVLGFITSIIVGLLTLRFLTSILGSSHTNFIYRLSNPLTAPFRGIASSTSSRVDFTALVSILCYGIIAWVIIALVDPGGRASE